MANINKNIITLDSIGNLPEKYTTADWKQAHKFNSKDIIVTNKDGRKIQIYDKKTRELPLNKKIGRAFAIVALLLISFGGAAKSKLVKKLCKFTISVRFAVPANILSPFRKIETNLFENKGEIQRKKDRNKRLAQLNENPFTKMDVEGLFEDKDEILRKKDRKRRIIEKNNPFFDMEVEGLIDAQEKTNPFVKIDIQNLFEKGEKLLILPKKDIPILLDLHKKSAAEADPEDQEDPSDFIKKVENNSLTERIFIDLFKDDLKDGKEFIDSLDESGLSKEAISIFVRLFKQAEKEIESSSDPDLIDISAVPDSPQ